MTVFTASQFKRLNKDKLIKYLNWVEELPNKTNAEIIDFYDKTDNKTVEHMFLDEIPNYEVALNPEHGSASQIFSSSVSMIKGELPNSLKKEEFVIITTPKEAERPIQDKVSFIPFDKIFFQCSLKYINSRNLVTVIESFIVMKDVDSNLCKIFLIEKIPQEKLSRYFCAHEVKESDLNSVDWEPQQRGICPTEILKTDVEKRFKLVLNVIRYVSSKLCSKEYRTYCKYENGKVITKELVYASEVRMHKRHFWEDSGKFIIPTLQKEEILSKGYFIDDLVFKDGELRQNVPYIIIGNHIRNSELEKKNREIDLIERRHLRQEEKIYSILRELYPDKIIRRHDRKTLNGIELDFNLPELRLGIEYDGEQHFDKELYEKLYGDGFHEQVKRDRLKDKLCNKKNIKLIRIKYNEPLTLSHINKRLQ